MTKKHRVLVVDDSITIINEVKSLLEQHDKTVITAGNGQEGLDLLMGSEGAIDLCISDINMPVMNGLDMLAKLREQKTDFEAPIIMLTTEFDRDIRKRGKVLGVRGWAIKPLDADKIIQCINKLLGD